MRYGNKPVGALRSRVNFGSKPRRIQSALVRKEAPLNLGKVPPTPDQGRLGGYRRLKSGGDGPWLSRAESNRSVRADELNRLGLRNGVCRRAVVGHLFMTEMETGFILVTHGSQCGSNQPNAEPRRDQSKNYKHRNHRRLRQQPKCHQSTLSNRW